MQENMDRLHRSFGHGEGEAGNVENWAIPLDAVQQVDNIIVKASVPGVNPEDLDVSIENKEERGHQEGNYLMRERRSGSFYRALRLPDTVDSDQAQPHYKHGVLSITFPRGGQGSEGQIGEGQTSPEQPSSGS